MLGSEMTYRNYSIRWLILVLLLASFASADMSEFETWRMDVQDTDDEYPLDHLFSLFGEDWQRAWRQSDQGMRLSNSCGTHEKWEIGIEAKLRRNLGRGFGIAYAYRKADTFSHLSEWNEISLSWRLTGKHSMGLYYRPRFAKADHDLGLRFDWRPRKEQGLGFDINFQRFVGNRIARKRSIEAEERWIYDRLPRFLSFWAALGSEDGARIALDGAVLMPTERKHHPPAIWLPDPDYLHKLEGARLGLDAHSPKLGPWRGLLSIGWKQGLDETLPLVDGAALAKRTERETLWLRPKLERDFNERWSASLLFEYRERFEDSEGEDLPPDGYHYSARSRSWQAGFAWRVNDRFQLDFGYAGSGIGVTPGGDPDWINEEYRHFDRDENRLYLTLDYRWRGVALLFTETFELDEEPYDSFLFHDKSFFQIMILL